MDLIKITADNISYAVQIQEELFPGESGRANFEEAIEDKSEFHHYLIYEDGVCAGIIGLYSYPEDQDSAWLGWFGIREGFRRKHLGSAALKAFEDMAAAKGYKFVRLYTDAEENDTAIAFYKANGYICEPYLNPQDPACMKYKTIIFSKSLNSKELVFWNSRNIHLTEQIAKQNKYTRHILIRTASLEDLDAVTFVEAECFPIAEAATRADFQERLRFYGNHFWLMFNEDKLIAFVDGLVTDEPDLTDEMYEKADMHNEDGRWQMIFGVNTLPEYRRRGYAGELIQRAIHDAKEQGRTGLVLTCKEKLVDYYARFGFVNEGKSEKSQHGGAEWYQMRLTF